MLDDWKDAFEPHILMRGRKYYQDGLITDLKCDGNDISAYIQGTDCYKVSIRLKNDLIHSAFCSCPYFQGGNNCKHMAAVMYAYSDRNAFDADDNSDSYANDSSNFDDDALYKAVHNADKSQLEKLVLILADHKQSNRVLIEKAFSCAPSIHKDSLEKKKSTDIDLTQFMSNAESIFKSYGDRHGFIDYHHAFDFEYDICDYLNTSADLLIESRRMLDAFKLSKYVFIRLARTDIDDDGNIAGICDTIHRIWTTVTDKCDESDYILIKNWFKKHCDDRTIVDYMRDYLEDFLKGELLSAGEMQQELNELDVALQKCEYDDTYNFYHRQMQVKRRVFLMQKLGASEEDARQFWFSHDELPQVREDLLEYYHSIGNYQEEIQLVIKYKKNANGLYEQSRYTQQLAELYHLVGDSASEKVELIHLINLCTSCPIDLFHSYKTLCDAEEWKKERDRIIAAEQNPAQKCQLLSEEKLYDRLFDTIEKSGQVSLYDKYGFLLEKYYTPQILSFYKKYIMEFAMSARNTARYRELSSYLKRMQQYKGGHQLVSEIASELAQDFPSRKQMVQMLNEFI